MSSLSLVQASPPGTASTLLCNILYGFFCPKMPVKWMDKSHAISRDDFISGPPVIKTHDMRFRNADEIDGFVCSERGHTKIPSSLGDMHNVVIFRYKELLETQEYTVVDIVHTVANKIISVLHLDITGNQITAAINRVNSMNEECTRMRDMQFSCRNDFFHIHGGHRCRWKGPAN